MSGGYGQAPAAPTAPPVTKFEDLRRGVGMFTGNGRHDWLPRQRRRCDRGRQPVHEHRRDLRGRPQAARAEGHRDADQHPSPRRSHRRQQGVHGVQKIVAHENCLEWHKAVTEEAKTVAQQAYATATFTDVWSEKFGDEKIEGRYYGPGHTGGDAVVSLPARQRRAHAATCCSTASTRASIARRRPRRQLDQGARRRRGAGLERHHLHFRPRQGQRRAQHQGRRARTSATT